MYRVVRFVACWSLFLVFIGLARGGDAGKALTTPYYPIAVGTTWSYRAGDNRFQLKITEIKPVGNSSRAKLELLVGGKPISHEHVGITKDAVVRFSFEGKDANPPIEFLRLPAKGGMTWKVNSKVDGQALTGTFKTGEEEVKVTAGTYKTITVSGQDLEANGVKLSMTYYFAKDVGMVKQVIELASQKIVIELEKYEPGK